MTGLRLGSPFGDHMVLQRGRPTRLWGWDEPRGEVHIALEGADVHFATSARADASGKFALDLPALGAKGPYRLRVQGSSTLSVEDILAGEVWIASGQSNMEWTVAQAADAEREIPAASYPEIRCLYVARVPARSPAETTTCRWFAVSPETAGGMTAVGYYFARELQRELGVPIGIVDASWGGTRVEAWAPAEALGEVLSLDDERARFDPPPAELAQIKAKHAEAFARWETEYLPADPRNEGEAWGFARADFDDSTWRELRVPGTWQTQGLRFNGAVWYRKEFELPAAWRGRDLLLSLGPVDDFDHTYVNGELVGAHPKGTPEAFQIQRRYRVRAALLRPGKNVIAVRVFDHVGEGGFTGTSHDLFLECADEPGQRLPLAGTFRVGVEREVPLVPLSVFAKLPPTPEPLQLQNGPCALYNGMLAPLAPYGVRGFLFYQGESNSDAAASYEPRFRAMIRGVRARFAQGTLPFYFVELAGFRDHDGWPRLREAQAAALSEPETGMASAFDIGDPSDIHPRNKQEVGRRLALLALARAYGRSDLVASGPIFASLELEENRCRVTFSEAAGLTTSDGAPARGFELAGSDLRFEPADATIDGTSVTLTSSRVPQIAAVRYAFKDYADVNLVNAAGLPARPFRSDRD